MMSYKKIAKIIPADERCVFCKKREATLLCDVPVMTVSSHFRDIGFKHHIITCDKRLCEECTIKVFGFDYCPDCMQKIKTASKEKR